MPASVPTPTVLHHGGLARGSCSLQSLPLTAVTAAELAHMSALRSASLSMLADSQSDQAEQTCHGGQTCAFVLQGATV